MIHVLHFFVLPFTWLCSYAEDNCRRACGGGAEGWVPSFARWTFSNVKFGSTLRRRHINGGKCCDIGASQSAALAGDGLMQWTEILKDVYIATSFANPNSYRIWWKTVRRRQSTDTPSIECLWSVNIRQMASCPINSRYRRSWLE